MPGARAETESILRDATNDEAARVEPDAAEEFAQRLAYLDVEQWLTVAAAAESDAPVRCEALAIIDALVNHLGVRAAAWSVVDDVTTCAHFSADHTVRRMATPRLAARLRTARNAANAAALALLVRPMLHAGDFDVLYRPFATLVPL